MTNYHDHHQKHPTTKIQINAQFWWSWFWFWHSILTIRPRSEAARGSEPDNPLGRRKESPMPNGNPFQVRQNYPPLKENTEFLRILNYSRSPSAPPFLRICLGDVNEKPSSTDLLFFSGRSCPCLGDQICHIIAWGFSYFSLIYDVAGAIL